MYADFFGLRELPFNNTPDPRFFYPTPDHEEALASLVYAVQERKGFVLLTGEVGAGKTLIARMMLRRFGSNLAFGTISHGAHSATDLMQSVCTEFELKPGPDQTPAQLVHMLQDFLLARFAEDVPVALVLDEAQSLPLEVFEQLRMIGNLEADDAKLLQVVIVGQPELQRRFASPEFRQLRQRIFRTFHLPALSRTATEAYIRHRLSIAGATSFDTFDEPAINAIHEFSKGLPRLINAVCDNAMLSAYSADRRRIDAASIDSVIRQMMSMGLEYDETQRHSAAPAPLQHNDPSHAWIKGAGLDAAEAAQDNPSMTPAASIEAVVRGVSDELERRFLARQDVFAKPAAPLNRSPEANAPPTAPPAAPPEREHDAFRRELQTRMTALAQQLTSVENRLAQAAPRAEKIASLEARLQPLMNQATTAIEQAAGTARKLTQREAALGEVSTRADGLLGEVRTLLGKLNRSAAKAYQAERTASETCHRLVTQSGRSAQLANSLRRLRARAADRTSLVDFDTEPVCEETTTHAPAGTTPPNAQPAVEDETGSLFRLLSGARTSLKDLRALGREAEQNRPADEPRLVPTAQAGETKPEAQAVDAASASRLAGHVEGLLELVQTD